MQAFLSLPGFVIMMKVRKVVTTRRSPRSYLFLPQIENFDNSSSLPRRQYYSGAALKGEVVRSNTVRVRGEGDVF
ncbi:MAG TPA: hypothetical protein VGB29_03060 [Thermodesulfobacteriota bacterium]